MHLRYFGFPRLKDHKDSYKRFKWKKTNFITDLPKHGAIVRYLVAKTKSNSQEFFMHAVVNKSEYNKKYKN